MFDLIEYVSPYKYYCLDEYLSWVLKYQSTQVLSLSLIIKLKELIYGTVQCSGTVSAKFTKISGCQHRMHVL